MLGCVNRNVTSKSKEVILIVYSVQVSTHLNYCDQFQAPQFKRFTLSCMVEDWA